MVAHSKTSPEAIVAAARAIIAARGIEALTLPLVAEAVGVRTPSLYKRFEDRAALVGSVRDALFDELAAVLALAAQDREPLAAMARAFRAFAIGHSRLYPLLFNSAAPPSPAALSALAPLLSALEPLVGAPAALAAARGFIAFLHGFVSLELSGHFQMAGKVDAAFDFGLSALIAGAVAPIADAEQAEDRVTC